MMEPERSSSKAVADRYGVNPSALVEIRKKMEPGIDYVVGDQKRITFTEIGEKKLAKILTVPTEEREVALASVPAVLWVKRACLNPRLVMAVRSEADVKNAAAATVRVRVKDGKKMVPGMRLEPCKQISADLFDYQGRHPRFRGRF